MSLMQSNPVYTGSGRVGNVQDLAYQNMSVQEIIGMEAELSGYRRSCLRVSIDLSRKIVTWKDSLQWNNNFMRSISQEKMTDFRRALPGTRILQWPDEYSDHADMEECASCHLTNWTIVLTFLHSSPVRITGTGQYPAEWPAFRDMIESITKVPFCLR
jgi:hypothetical protein